MPDKINELLAVLDLPKEEQYLWVTIWIADNLPNAFQRGERCELSLADLAFRLRDAVVKKDRRDWDDAVVVVSNYCKQPIFLWPHYSQPIHWIIAALIAKELQNAKIS